MISTDYEGPERRNDALTEDRVKLLIQTAVTQAMRDHEAHVLTHMDKQFSMLRQAFNDSFPGGDPHGHRIAHEKAIQNAGWWDRIKSEAISKTVTGSVWVFLVFVAVVVWEHIKQEAKK
jgi:hypothetical protein